MKLSVVIPTLNEEQALPALLGALRHEQVFEIVVADGGSKDQTEQVAKKFGATFLNCTASGRPCQMNLGAEATTGDVLYFVHADTIPPTGFLQDISEALSKGYQAGCYRYRFRGNHPHLKLNEWFTGQPFLFCRGGDQTLFITRDLFEAIGGFDEKYVVMEDYEMVKAIRKRSRFRIVPRYATVSARKYVHNSYVRVNLANAIVFFLYTLNTEPTQLWRLYKRLIRHPKAS